MTLKKNSAEKNSAAPGLAREIIGLFFIFLALFSLLSLLTYSSGDPSWFTVSSAQAKNWCGRIGSYWSALWLQFMGASAYMMCFILLLSGAALFRKVSGRAWWIAFANNLVLLLTFSAFLGLFQSHFRTGGSTYDLGGYIGAECGGLLSRYLNTAGAALLTFAFFVLALSLSLRVSIRDLALYSWLAVSKFSLYMASVALLAAMETKILLQKSKEILSPKLLAMREKIIATWRKQQEQARNRKEEKVKQTAAAAVPTIVKIQPSALATAPDAILSVESSPSEVAQPVINENADITAASDPLIITEHNSLNVSTSAVFREDEELPPLDPGVKKTSLVEVVRRASKDNERAVKTALGKKTNYELPPLSFMRNPSREDVKIEEWELINNSRLLEEKLANFRIEGKVTAVKPGPVVTMYEFKPGSGVKVNAIANLSDDLALALAAESVRIVAPIPGRDVVGIELPNKDRQKVFLKEIIGSEAFQSRRHAIPIAIGKDILGEPMVADLRKMPHMLVAGATGSGKSVFVNALICSLLYRFRPDELKLILVDPKQLELNLYDRIPHLLLPVVTEPKKASLALRWAVDEMERRYTLIAKSGMRDADGYNQKLASIGAEAMAELVNKGAVAADGMLIENGEAEQMPKLIIVIDELADLMMTAKADVENNICRLAQKARAAGIHLVLATQRPSVDVVTGLIKANLPARISFRLSSKNDSRTIFDCMGAERLVGMGDMLFMPPGESRLVRMHGAFLAEDEIEQITNFWRNQGTPEYREEILVDPEDDAAIDEFGDALSDSDPLFKDALDIVMTSGFASASMLQRRLRVGYNRAARMVETMEARGIVGPADGSKPRPVIASHP